jgi:hypothetical protein
VTEKAARVKAIADAALEEVKAQGLTPEAAGKAVHTLGEKVGAIGQAASQPGQERGRSLILKVPVHARYRPGATGRHASDPELGRDFRLQRIIVLGDLLMASRPDYEGDRDIRRCRELKRGRAKIHAITSSHLAEFFALFDHCRGDQKFSLA